jgi:hypothetical protein
MCLDILGFLWKDFWKWDSQRREVVLNQADPLLLYQSESPEKYRIWKIYIYIK